MSETKITKNTKKPENKPVPKGATVLSTDTKIDVEEIENGYLITRTTETRYKVKPDAYTDYSYDTKKYYSKEDPLTITTKDKALADLFDEE